MANVVKIILDGVNKSDAAFNKAEGNLKKLSKAADQAKLVVGAAVTAAAAGIGYLTREFLLNADATTKLSRQIGVSTEFLTGFRYAAELGGVKVESLRIGFKLFSDQVDRAGRSEAAALDIFNRLNIAVTDQSGALKTTESLVLEVADSFSRMEDGATKASIAGKLFSETGLQLIPLLNSGSKGIAEMRAEAEELGIVLKTQDGVAAEQFNDNITRLQRSLSGMIQTIGVELLPALNAAADWMVAASKESGAFQGIALTIVDVLKAMAQGAVVLWQFLKSLASTLAFLADILYTTVATAINLNIRLFKTWADAIRESVKIAANGVEGLSKLGESMQELAQGRGIAAAILWKQGMDLIGDSSRDAFANVNRAVTESGEIVAQSTTNTLDYMKERWALFADENVDGYEKMMARIMAIDASARTPAGPGAPARTPAGGGDSPAALNALGGIAKAQFDEQMAGMQLARDNVNAMREQELLDAMTHIEALRQLEEMANVAKIDQINEQFTLKMELAAGNKQAELQAEAEHQAALAQQYADYSGKLLAIDSQVAAQKKAIQQANLTATSNFLSAGVSLAQTFGKKAFAVQQGLQIGQSIMNTYTAANQALSSPPGPPWTLPLVASVIAMGIANVAQVASQKPSFATGIDYVPYNMSANIHEGERVVPAETNQDLSDFLDSGAGNVTVNVTIGEEQFFDYVYTASRDGRLRIDQRAIA